LHGGDEKCRIPAEEPFEKHTSRREDNIKMDSENMVELCALN
jgi:hypothetical protein